MSNSHKRNAEAQLTADNYDDDGRYGDWNFTTEPCYASAETMATRRILHVKRPNSVAGISTTSTDDSNTVNKNPFQFLDVKMPEATTATTSSSTTTTNVGATTAQPFTFTTASTNVANPFTAKFPLSAFGNQQQTSTQPPLAAPSTSTSISSSATAKATLSSTNTTHSGVEGFNANTNNNSTLNSHQESTKPAFTFNFGNIQHSDNDNQSNIKKRARLDESAHYESQTLNKESITKLPESNVQKQNEPFKFNFLAQPETKKSLEQGTSEGNTSNTMKKEGSSAINPFTSAYPLFGGGAFNFKGAVNSFVEARKKMEQQGTFSVNNANNTDLANGSGNTVSNMGENTAKDSSENVEEADESASEEKTEVLGSGELIISVPVKLYCFVKVDKPQGEWAERGVGDAKLKRVEKNQGASRAQEVNESTNHRKTNVGTGDDKSSNDKNTNTSTTNTTNDNNNGDNSKGTGIETNEKSNGGESKNDSKYIIAFSFAMAIHETSR